MARSASLNNAMYAETMSFAVPQGQKSDSWCREPAHSHGKSSSWDPGVIYKLELIVIYLEENLSYLYFQFSELSWRTKKNYA
jgi:hypothetical protein